VTPDTCRPSFSLRKKEQDNMATLQKELPTPSAVAPIKAADAKKLEPVAANKYYRVVFQLGPRRSFGRAFPSQAWTEKKDSNGGPSSWDPVYRVYDQILEAREVNGLIQENNDWQAANIRQKVEGNINRMLIVLDVKELKDYVPATFNFSRLLGGAHIIQGMIDAAVKAALAEAKPAVASK